MKKMICLFAVILFAIPLFVFGCATTENEILNSYTIVATYDDENKNLDCMQEVCYVNDSENSLSEVCFFLYPNAFAEGKKVVSTSYTVKAYPNGESYGNIEFASIQIDGADAEYEINESGSVLTVKLPSNLYPNETITIAMEYTVNLANIRHRLGYGDSTVNFGNFFPIACVYDDGFVMNDFATNGDPFYSDVANFDVTIIYPNNFILASTGEQTSTTDDGSTKTTVCKAENVRDFCFVLSEKFEVLTATVGDVEINYFYYDDENAQAHLETAVMAVETFSELFGEYPYSQLSVVKNDFCFGGMEYPNLVMIADDLADEETIVYVIVHEIAHQWWYGVVGNNEYTDAWIDEGLTEYSCALFFEINAEYGLEYDTIMQNAMATYQNFVRIFKSIYGQLDESMNRNLSEYATEPEYVNITYTKGMLLFDSLRSMMSDRKFFACLKNYFEEYAFENSSAEKLIESFSKTASTNLESFFQSWIDGSVLIGV